MARKKVLLVWWYDRKDLIAPYLEMQDEIEFTVLFYRFPHQENKRVAESLPFRRVYWLDYLSPYQLLKDVHPDKILFIGNESVLTISLITAANIKQIPTCYVSHGLRSDIKNQLEEGIKVKYVIERYSKENTDYTQKKWHTLIFLFLTFSIKNLSSISLIFQVIRAELKGGAPFKKLKEITSPLRQTKSYYLFAPENSLMHKELDKADENRFLYSGPYTMDRLFKSLHRLKPVEEKNFWLIIDQPVSTITWEERLNLYLKIANKAKLNGGKLIIKLHPMEYEREFIDSDNIQWIKTNDHIEELILAASGIIGFHSAMQLPIICYKKCILFDIHSTSLVQKWEDCGVIKKIDYSQFSLEDINFDTFEVRSEDRQKFIKQFITYTDGNCTERLKEMIINSQH